MKSNFLLIALCTLVSFCFQSTVHSQVKKNDSIHQQINLTTDRIFNKLVQVRRDFHENPELAGKEVRTQEVIKKHLLSLGLKVQTDVYGKAVIGILEGSKKGKRVAWRADMDALPNSFTDKVDFPSKNEGVQHGCGHDIHMAIALGIAEVLTENRKAISGTVYFIFQPEEETFVGAKKMVENAKFAKLKLDEIYGLHVTALPVGQVMVKPNEVFAYQRRVQIRLSNALSEEKISDLTKKIDATLFRVASNSKPWELPLVVDPKVGLASPNTIFKDYLISEKFDHYTKNDTWHIEANLYETEFANLKNIISTISKVVESTGYTGQLQSISFTMENPTVKNDPQLTDFSIETLNRVYGNGFVARDYGQVPFFNDDFAYFQQKVKGVYFLFGGSNFQKGVIAMNHAPDFEVDEECIRIGVRTFSSLLTESLEAK